MIALRNLQRRTESASRPVAVRRLRRTLKSWFFLSPLLIINALVIAGPMLGTIYYAFTDWPGLGPAHFTGLENFRRLFTDEVFWRAFSNNVIWTALFLTVPICMGLLGAALLRPVKTGQLFFRTAYFIPFVLASVVNAQIWRNILNPSIGVGVQLAELGFTGADIKFFGDERVVLYTIAFVDNWRWWGFLVVIYLAAMKSVDSKLYEAARLEGASRWQEFWYVTLPSIRPTLIFTLLITVIFSFLVFDYVYILTRGGPANASEVLSTMAYKAAFARFEAGYAATIGLTTSIVCLVMGLIFVGLRRRGWNI